VPCACACLLAWLMHDTPCLLATPFCCGPCVAAAPALDPHECFDCFSSCMQFSGGSACAITAVSAQQPCRCAYSIVAHFLQHLPRAREMQRAKLAWACPALAQRHTRALVPHLVGAAHPAAKVPAFCCGCWALLTSVHTPAAVVLCG
jgi:hypothetical protein